MGASAEPVVTPEGACNVVAARLRINSAREVRVCSQVYEGRPQVHIREFFLNEEDEFLPTSKGVALPITRLSELIEGVARLHAAKSEPGVFSELVLSVNRCIRFSIVAWQGATKADIRVYYRPTSDADWRPGKGVRFNLGLLKELERGLDALESAVWPEH